MPEENKDLGRTLDDIRKSYNTPEAKKKREQERAEKIMLAEKTMSETMKCEITDLQNNLLLSCLKTNVNLYKEYADTIKEKPEYQKYLQFYKFKGKNFIIIPILDKNTNKFCIKTIQLEKQGDISVITRENKLEAWDSDIHPYRKNPNVFSIMIHDDSKEYGYSTISMNKRTGEISDIDPKDYPVMNEKGVNGLLDVIADKSGKKLSDCSEGLQNHIRDIVSKEDELKKDFDEIADQRMKLIDNLINGDISGAVSNFIDIVKSFFIRKKKGRVIDIGEGLNYEGDEGDFDYLQSAIETVLDPEQRSKLTYLISQIKNKKMKQELNEKGIENPSPYNLLLQQCKPGQIMLTNALDTEGSSSNFKYATQLVSGSRWCHALIISDVIRDNNGIVTDLKIIQSTLKGGVHETNFNEYVKSNYSSADFLLADLPEGKSDTFIQKSREKIGEKYDRISVALDGIFGTDMDKDFDGGRFTSSGSKKSFCSELIFDAMEGAGLKLPEPHVSPSDILMSDQIAPQYACYCKDFE